MKELKMDTQERLKSIIDMLDSLESMELKPNLTFEDYKKLTRKITLMLFSAYNTGYENGYKQGKEGIEMSPCEALELLQKGVKLEYYRKDDDYWWTLYKDQPIYILWKYEIRIKK